MGTTNSTQQHATYRGLAKKAERDKEEEDEEGEGGEVEEDGPYFSNQSVRLVVWRIMRRRLGEFSSLSSLVQTLPTSSDGWTALREAQRRRRGRSHTCCSLFKALDTHAQLRPWS